jgi:pimeloyl-ACP methyl ester carboxylesterase
MRSASVNVMIKYKIKRGSQMRYVYIHGANATAQSFNYINHHLGGDPSYLEYHSGDGFHHNLDQMIQQIEDQHDLFIVAHSLGGIYALHLANHLPKNIIGAVTISTPYGGVGIAEMAKWLLPHSILLRDIAPSGSIITSTMRLPLLHPWCQIVTTRGDAPWIPMTNDGVVTLQSMRARPDMDLIDVDLNHYEIMQSTQVVEIVRSRTP